MYGVGFSNSSGATEIFVRQHRILGASGFGSTYDPVKIRQSTCTTVPAQADSRQLKHDRRVCRVTIGTQSRPIGRQICTRSTTTRPARSRRTRRCGRKQGFTTICKARNFSMMTVTYVDDSPQLKGGSGPGSYVEPFPDNFQVRIVKQLAEGTPD